MRRPPPRRKNLTKRSDEFSAEKQNSRNKTRNKWRLHRPHGQERSLVKREMALAEVLRREAAKKLSSLRSQVLRGRNLLERVGGAAFVTNLFTFVPTAANVQYYLEIVRDKYILRQIISAATESVRRAYEEQDEVDSLLDEVEQKIFDVGEDRFKGQMLSMKDHAMQAIETIEKLYERKGSITGISTGFVEFDRMTSGLHPSEMVVIAARPSMGKTALAMNIAEYVAISEKLPVGVFSLEMSSQQLVQRMLCSRARVNLQRVRDGFLGERDLPSLTAAASKLAEAQI